MQGEPATMVITDIQSSAKLTNAMPAAMSADHDRHDRLLRHLMLLYNGIEVATEGDSFHVRPALLPCAVCPRAQNFPVLSLEC